MWSEPEFNSNLSKRGGVASDAGYGRVGPTCRANTRFKIARLAPSEVLLPLLLFVDFAPSPTCLFELSVTSHCQVHRRTIPPHCYHFSHLHLPLPSSYACVPDCKNP